jgi:hypothetical protein
MERRGKRRSHHMDDVSMMEEKRREWIRGEEISGLMKERM